VVLLVFCFFSNLALSALGFNVETVKRKNLSFSVWDVGGQDQVKTFYLIFFYFLRHRSYSQTMLHVNRFEDFGGIIF